ncbi:MAG: LuxR C-terminal-related transcriptional regulator [Anaerolineaceae bacterium]|nr:LuxR C-terminal-related transcriptional regulator [Anaerolineaceae bacterium]
MDYISVKEAAKKWGINPRRVQELCKKKRIDGVKRWGKTWMIPFDTQKPEDGRCKQPKQKPPKETSPFLKHLFCMDTMQFQSGQAMQIIESISETDIRQLAKAEFDYMRGSFETAMLLYKASSRSDRIWLSILSVAQSAAISTGNYRIYHDIQTELAELQDMFKDNQELSALIKLAMLIGKVSIYVPILKMDLEEFKILPVETRRFATYVYTKYLHMGNKDEKICGIVESFQLFSTQSGYSASDIYLMLMYTAALERLGKRDLAKKQLVRAMQLALPDGFITPFAEHVTTLAGLVENCLEQFFPSLYKPIINQSQDTYKNWLQVHNIFTQNHLSLTLSVREFQVATLLAAGLSNAKIANQMSCSVANVKKIVSIILNKLYVKNRYEVKKFVIPKEDSQEK